MSAIVEYPILQVPVGIIRAIAQNYAALDAINSESIMTNAHCYAGSAEMLDQASQLSTHSAALLAKAWCHRELTIVSVPEQYLHTIDRYSVEITQLSEKLHTIAVIGRLAKKHAHEHVTRFNTALTQFNQELDGATSRQEKEYIITQACTVARKTHDGLIKIADIYQRAITTGITIDPQISGLGISLEHLPPLYGPDGIPTVEGIDQCSYNDCYFLSTIGAIAFSNPQLIKDAIKEDPDTPGGYLVTLFRNDYALTTQKISPEELRYDLHQGKYDKDRNGQHQLWPYVLETAWAKMISDDHLPEGDAYLLKRGGQIASMMHIATGKPVKSVTCDSRLDQEMEFNNKDQLLQQIATAVAQQRPVTMGVYRLPGFHPFGGSFTSNGHKIHTDHAYMVLGVQGDKILIRNPWGHGDRQGASFLVNPEDLARHLAEFAIQS